MQLNYRQYSSAGPPLILLHGLYGNQANLAWLARQLAGSFTVFAIDARNHGQSGWQPTMSYDELAGDLLETIDMLGLGSVSLLGHSMGGKTAMRFALLHPDRMQSLIVIDIAPVDYHKPGDKVIGALQQLDLAMLESRQDADTRLAASIPEKGVRDFLLTNLQRDCEGRFSWRINLPVLAGNFSVLTGWPPAASSWEGPALFIRGEHSPYIEPAHEADIWRQFPAAEITTVSGAGHWVHSEKPGEVLELVSGFLDQHKH
jgi:esterase